MKQIKESKSDDDNNDDNDDDLLSEINIGGKFCLFICFVALRPKSTAMVMAGLSVHLTKLFSGQA